MTDYVLPVVFVLLAWWGSTGVVFWLDGLPRRTFHWSMLGATLMLVMAVLGLTILRDDTSVRGAYLGFACGLGAWAWHEMAFLMGFVSGPRRVRSTPGVRGWPRFVEAVQAVLWHELAILATAIVMVMVTLDAPNQTGTWIFVALAGMRLSTKLNLFLGVRNRSESLLPPHLRYVGSYFGQARMNGLFPVSVTVATLLAAGVVQRLMAPRIEDGGRVGLTLIATLLVLATLEHWFLVLPLPVNELWRWGLGTRGREPIPALARE
jgi:putative photosynthetic complex assembly protein 2